MNWKMEYKLTDISPICSEGIETVKILPGTAYSFVDTQPPFLYFQSTFMVFVTKLTSSGLTYGGNVVGALLINFGL